MMKRKKTFAQIFTVERKATNIKSTLALIFGILLQLVPITAMEKDVKQIANNDQPAPQQTFHHFPELAAETQQEIMSLFIPPILAQEDHVLGLFNGIVKLSLVSKDFTEIFLKLLEQSSLLAYPVKRHIRDNLLHRQDPLRSLSRALIKDRLLTIARTIVERKSIKNVEKMLAQTMSILHTGAKRWYALEVMESVESISRSRKSEVAFYGLLEHAIHDLCPEVALLAGCYQPFLLTNELEDKICIWADLSRNLEAETRERERFLVNKLFIFLDSVSQLYIKRFCVAQHGVHFALHNDLDHRLIYTYPDICQSIIDDPEECLSKLLEDPSISDIYKSFLIALRGANIPALRSLINNNFNNYFREVLLSFALRYAVAKNREDLVQALLEYPISSEMLLALLKIVIRQENSALCIAILSRLDIPKEYSNGDRIYEQTAEELFFSILSCLWNNEPCKKIILALCAKLDFPAIVLDCIDACFNSYSEEQVTIAQSSNKFDCYSIRIIMYILIRNGHSSAVEIRSFLDILCQLFTRRLSSKEIARNMDGLIEAADFYDQLDIAADLRHLKWTYFTI